MVSIAELYVLTVSVTKGVGRHGVCSWSPAASGGVILRSWTFTEWSRGDEEADGFHGSLFGRSKKNI